MFVAGIDLGAEDSKAVILKDFRIISFAKVPSGYEQGKGAKTALGLALKDAGLDLSQFQAIGVTGSGAEASGLGYRVVKEAKAMAKGALFLLPSARTILDVGAEEARVLKVDSKGNILGFELNERCAAGAGAFIKAMARAMELDLEEMAKLSLKSQNHIPMNAQCAIFAESEVVSLIHSKTPREDISKAIHDAVSGRVGALVRKLGLEPEVFLMGGVARNIGFVDSLKKNLKMDIYVPQHPEFVPALGAALCALT